MAKNDWKEKWRKRAALGVMTLLSVSLALGALSACGAQNDDEDDEDDTTISRTDTQLIKNGDFEFYSEMDKKLEDKRAFISSPSDWSFTSGSPSSNTTSGIIDVNSEEWDLYTQSKFSLVPADDASDAEKAEFAKTAISNAMKNWEKASVYDRLEFYDVYDDELDDLSSSSEEKKFFNKYKYSVDFEDVEKLRADLGDSVETHAGKTGDDAETGMLMIHNQRTSDGARGTGQYYTSSSTITLKPGTAAKVSVWVKTQELYHFYEKSGEDEKFTAITRDSVVGGAYIGVTNTVGSTTLDQMQIKNIRSPYNNAEEKAAYEKNNGWVQYTVFVRGSTFADSTFKLVLGLGQSTSSNRYEAVDGYALFDDVECTIMSSADYERESGASGVDPDQTYNHCTLDSVKNEKIFDTAKAVSEGGSKGYFAYGLDLAADFTTLAFGEGDAKTDVTTELSGSKLYESKVPDNRDDATVAADRRSIAGLYSYDALSKATGTNGYLANFFEKDFKAEFPFGNNASSEQVVMLLSTNGAAYTTTLQSEKFTVAADDRLLVSFFVKTSEIRKGSGASATVIDEGGNKTNISAFDSTTLDTVDIDNNETESYNRKDLYNGWTQCFFFVENATEIRQTFTIELHYGTTSVATAAASDYDDGYAAFTRFETCSLSSAQYNYVSTGARAVKVSLSDVSKDVSSFDSASRTSDIEKGFATPVNFNGVLSTSAAIDPDGTAENKVPDGVYTGLLNAAHAEKYQAIDAPWVQKFNAIAGATSSAKQWWNNIFADDTLAGRVSNQPLVIINTNDSPVDSYGYFLYNTATVSADSYQKISMRAKISEGATAYFYLNDASDVKKGYGSALAPSVPKITYWYDDEGNIVAKDPASDDYNKKTDILFYLETNGLYTQAGATDGVYYANLHNYDTDENGNLVTSDDKTIAYHYDDETKKYYCDYDEKKDAYSRPVENLPTTDDKGNSIVRYTAPESMKGYESAIKVVGTGKWVDVSFFVHTGNEAKTYRLEIWAGARDNKQAKMKEDSYYFFDSYSSTDVSSNYETLLNEKIENLKQQNNIAEEDNLPKEYALYSTFTFYDAPWYLRYDETTDEDNEGNPYANYKQSSNSEKLICLVYDNSTGAIENDDLTYSYFLDYSAYNVTVEKSTNNDTDDDNTTDDDDTTNNDSNIWLILSSVLLVVALLFAAGIVIGRAVIKHLKKTGRISSTKKVKVKKRKPVKIEKEESEAPAEEEKPANPDDPYNE